MKNINLLSSFLILLCGFLNLGFLQAHAFSHNHATKTEAALICIPGLTQQSSTYDYLARQLKPFGISVIAFDVKGFQKALPGEKPELIDFEQTLERVKLTCDAYRRNHPDTPVFVLGESTGGTIALRLAAKYPLCVDGILCSAPTWRVDDRNKIAALELLDLTVFRARKHGLAVNYVIKKTTHDKELQAHLMQEKERRQRFTIGESIKFMKFINSLPRTCAKVKNTPVLIVQGLNDRLSNSKWAAIIFNKIAGSKKTIVLDVDAEHLILEEGQCQKKIVESIKNWIVNNINGENSSHPQGILLSCNELSDKEKKTTQDLFKLAGVIPATTLALDSTGDLSEVNH